MEEENNLQPEMNNTPGTENKKGFNIASLVLGIIGIIGSCCWYINLPCSILAIIFSVIGKNSEGKGMGMAGRVLGIIAIVILVVIYILAIIGVAALADSGMLDDLNSSLYY